MAAAATHPRQASRLGNRASAAPALLVALTAACLTAAAASAADKTITFLGEKVVADPHAYVVVKDVNVRAKSTTKSGKVGSLREGTRVQTVAKAPGGWRAVRDGNADLGFVHESTLLPLIDGTLKKDLAGKVKIADGPACDYVIRFEGKSPVEGQPFEIADYDINWTCMLGANKIGFRTPMFITEAPFQLNQKRVFQISVDMLDLYGGDEVILSTIVLYEEEKRRVVFDSVTLDKYGRKPPDRTAPAKTVAEALDGAARIAVAAWNKSAWNDLVKNLK